MWYVLPGNGSRMWCSILVWLVWVRPASSDRGYMDLDYVGRWGWE